MLAGRSVLAQTVTAEEEIVLTHTGAGFGTYVYLPFEVPAGVNRVAVSVAKTGDVKHGVGLFDQRGAGYQSAGFRGVYGEERSSFSVAAHEASQSFLPGPIEAGTWTVIVPVFQATTPYRFDVTVRLTHGPQQAPFVPGPEAGVVVDEPGWYRGDLHCHTPESSDAWASDAAFTVREWGDECRRIGLDYAAMTDHNVVTQNLDLAAAAGAGVLLLPGEEMTNWFHGHATVSGIEVGQWLDWRQRPGGVPLLANEARIQDFVRVAEEMGAYVSAAHPTFANLAWQFFGDGAADPAARTHGVEVWTGNFQPDDEASLALWDGLLRQGQRVYANGGSDLHGRADARFKYRAGTPTTVVYAERLEKRALVDALRAGRSFVTRLPDGVEAYLTATGPAGQRVIVGGSVYGEAGDVADVSVHVRRGSVDGPLRVIVWANGAPLSTTPVGGDEIVVTARVPVGPTGGYVRAEVRGLPFVDEAAPLASRMDMEAFTNPIFLVNGAPPGGAAGSPPPGAATPPAARPAPRPGAVTLPATGGGSRVPSTGGAAAAAAAGLTLTALLWHARAGTVPDCVRIVGEVTGPGVVSRWTSPRCGCADHDEQVDVSVQGLDAPVGSWVAVEGRWVGDAIVADRVDETVAEPRREL